MKQLKMAWDLGLRPWMWSSIFSLCLLITIYAFPMTACAFQLTLAWDTNSEPDVSGYKIYYGEQSQNYTYCVDVGSSTSCVISGLTPGQTYYFTATAYDVHGNESSYAQELDYQVPDQEPDADNDGMPDAWEIKNNLDPTTDDADEDPDEDAFTNLEEYSDGTDPRNPNSFPSLSETNIYPAITLLLLEN
ncbi:MAG: fibronectin type III domain-containing protein [Deltaproteobacteria bacterium]|nr:fibronectin type III domain-containing protein [Deltaproteobacteria bacterium]